MAFAQFIRCGVSHLTIEIMSDERILIIDDDVATGVLFSRIAEMAGYEVRAVNTAEEAKEAVLAWTPTTIILDMVMPDMDGIEMVGWLVDNDYGGRILFVSGFADAYLEAAATMARAKGISDVTVLKKPVAVADLRSALSV